ncbi:MAG: hypothetical protein U0793_01775 [Gemmataceae bacterium]
MKRKLWLAALGLGMLSGCQTWVPEAGVTMPSPYYLRHTPTYIPPSPPFPLSRELDSLTDAASRAAAAPAGVAR